MEQLRSNVTLIIWSGFVVIIVLMVILSSVLFYKLNEQFEQFSNVVKINNTKVSLAHAMRDAIRLRSNSLSKIALSNDIFYRDEERVDFNIYANRFIRAFNRFEDFDLDITEVELVAKIRTSSFFGYPLSQRATSMLLSDSALTKVRPVLNAALKAHDKSLNLINELISLQKIYVEQSLITTEKNMENVLLLLLVVVSVSILFSIVVSQTVSQIVSHKNTELEKATKSKSMFLANMSHEIRTPLTAIIGFSKAQMIPNLPAEHNERATKIILRNSEHLLTVINDILDFSKIESQKLELEYTEFSLFTLMDEIHLSLVGLIGNKSIKFSTNYTYPLPEFITTDKTRLRQVLINLGSNAIKFTEQGFINFNIHYNSMDDDLYFDVNDSGIGMTHEQQKLVFQSFSQAELSTTRKFGGTGLGLTISNHLVTLFGGELSLRSDYGAGSTFSFKIHNRFEEFGLAVFLIEHPPAAEEQSNANINIENNHFVQGTVLVVEDMPDNQELFTLFLEEMGATVTTVSDGLEAVEITATDKFDLVLMDMQMPIMGGIEAVKLIRERGDKFPIVMVTANASREYEQSSIDSGCDGYLSKPINEQKLSIVVKQFLTGLQQTTSDNVIVSSLKYKNQSNYNKIINKFINHLPEYVDDIGELIKLKNDLELKELTHKLKGVGGNMGFKVLTDISIEFETAIKQGNRDELARLFDELKRTANKIYQGNESTLKTN